MGKATGLKWVGLLLSNLFFSPYLQYLIYQTYIAHANWSTVSFFRVLLFLYFIPFLVGSVCAFIKFTKDFSSFLVKPFYLGFSKLVLLVSMNTLALILDYAAIFYYGSQTSTSPFYFVYGLPLLIMIQMMITQVAVHLISVNRLNRYLLKKCFLYLAFQLGGVLIYNVTAFDANPTGLTYNSVSSLFGSFYFVIYRPQSKNAWLPYFLVIFTSVLHALIIVFSKRFFIEEAFMVKSEQFSKQKMKLQET